MSGGGRIAVTRLRTDPQSFMYFSQVRQPARLIVHDAAAWRGAWATLWPNGAPIPAPPEIDFTREMVVMAALGERPSSGYTILVDSATLSNKSLTIWIGTIRPGPHCGTATVLTQPVDVARLPRIDATVRFEEVPSIRDCQ